jgi:hypothetical protein
VLSCLGKNITDQRLLAKDGGVIPFVRTPNHDETLGPVAPERIACGDRSFADLWKEEFKSALEHTGLSFTSVPAAPAKVVMRYQTAFVGLHEGETRDVCPANFSYQTFDDGDPRNLLLVVTPTGIHVHTDGVGFKKLYAHSNSGDGTTKESWFQVEETAFVAGQVQTEAGVAEGERPSPKRARVSTLGVEGSGASCNRMLVFSIPLKQTRAPVEDPHMWGATEETGGCVYCSLVASPFEEEPVFRSAAPTGPAVGRCRAGRLNVGEDVGVLTPSELVLTIDETEAVMCTQIDYSVLVAPSTEPAVTIAEEAAKITVAEMKRMYGLCDTTCKLSDLPACLHELSRKDVAAIVHTLSVTTATQLIV